MCLICIVIPEFVPEKLQTFRYAVSLYHGYMESDGAILLSCCSFCNMKEKTGYNC